MEKKGGAYIRKGRISGTLQYMLFHQTRDWWSNTLTCMHVYVDPSENKTLEFGQSGFIQRGEAVTQCKWE